MRGLKPLAACCIIAMIWLLSGCAQILIPGALAGAGELYRYNTGNIAKQTFYGDMARVSTAATAAFEKLEIKLTGVDRTTGKTVLHGSTPELKITVKLEPVTAATTRATVDASKNQVIKDKATAEEILTQIGLSLNTENTEPKPARQHSAVFAKNNCDRPIKVAIYCLTGPKGSEIWDARGWFFIEPGHKKHIVDTNNRYVYLYAESRTGKKLLWRGKSYHKFNGKPYGFFKVDIGRTFTDFTQSFTCD